MSWPLVTLADVAPSSPIKLEEFGQNADIWQITLDHIESNTGHLLQKSIKPLSKAGSSTHVFDDRHVLYSKLRPYLNKVLLPDEIGIGTTELVPMLPDSERLDRNYLAHYLKSNNFVSWISSQTAGAKMPRVSMKVFWDHKIPLPPLKEQKRIAAILDKADALRRKRQQAIDLTDQLIRSVFLDMFGDPITNPKGWEVHPFSKLVGALEGGKNVKPGESGDATLNRILKVSAVTSGVFRSDESKPLPNNFEPPESYFVKKEDLLISRANTSELIGATAFVYGTPSNIVLPDKIWRIRWKNDEDVNPLYVHYLFKQTCIRREISIRSSGTSGSMKNIPKPKLLEIPIPIPPVSAQNKFGEIVKNINATRITFRSGENEIENLLSSLTQQAFQGELTKQTEAA